MAGLVVHWPLMLQQVARGCWCCCLSPNRCNSPGCEQHLSLLLKQLWPNVPSRCQHSLCCAAMAVRLATVWGPPSPLAGAHPSQT
jgi:hypothetical protein